MKKRLNDSFFAFFAFARRYSEGILLAVVLAIVVRTFVLTSFRVGNDIMAPTLMPGDYVVAYRLPFGVKIPFMGSKIGQKLPARGSVVVFPCVENPGTKCIRRVVGLPGDRVELKSERLIVNGELAKYSEARGYRAGITLREQGVSGSRLISISGSETAPDFGPYIVPPAQVFLLSDHRDLGVDSRQWGGIPFQSVEAQISLIWISWQWPIESNTAWPGIRWDRVFRSPD